MQFVKETKINFPIWLGGSTDHMYRFGLGAALPGTVVIGRDGRVKKVISGVIDQVVLRKLIDSLLAVPIAKANVAVSERKADVSAVPS